MNISKNTIFTINNKIINISFLLYAIINDSREVGPKMKEEDLEKTKSLEELSILGEKNSYEDYDNLFREKKYSNLQENLDAAREIENGEVDSNGDIINDDQNAIPAIETLLLDDENNKEDKVTKEVEKILNEGKKKNIFKRMIETFKEMPKKKKILFIILLILILASIVGVICLFVFGKDKKKEDTSNEEEKDVIVIKDNYIYKNGDLIFLDEEDNEIGTYTCKNQDEKLCYIAFKDTNEDDFYKITKLYEDETEILSRISIFFNRYAFVYDNKNENDGMISLYDFKNKEVVSQYRVVKNHHVGDKDYIITQEENGTYKMYEMTETGLEVRLDKDYKYLGIMDDKENSHVIAKVSSGYYLLDLTTGKELTKLIGKQIFNYSDDYIVTVADGVYSLYNYNNEQKLTGYKFINIEDNYIVTVDKNNNLFYRDSDLIKVNEEGFTLNNDNYLPKKIYSNDGILQENIYAYQSNFTEDSITIAIRDDEVGTDYFKSVSLNEYAYNKTINNYSYSNGVLYFYSDENKEALIGKYTCKNKNEDFKEGEILANCHPALDTIYEDNDMTYDDGRVSMAPIINNQYVFIYDGTTNTKNVILYDLVENKAIVSNYESVNTYTEANKGVLSLVNVDSINVIAKSKKEGKYGMIKISKDGITPVYDGFSYGSMEMINGKVLVTNGGKSKILYSTTSSSPEFDGKIRGFIGDIDYYKVKKDSNYYVYDADGNKVSQTGYKYVELYSNIYAGVDSDNKLMLYNYDGQEMIDSKIQLSSTTYYGNASNAFMVAASGNKVVVSVYKDGKYESVEKILGIKEEQKPENSTEETNLPSGENPASEE
ncbi:MAG: hypothetical protein ACI31M_04350 [Bacilli bacterium]